MLKKAILVLAIIAGLGGVSHLILKRQLES